MTEELPETLEEMCMETTEEVALGTQPESVMDELSLYDEVVITLEERKHFKLLSWWKANAHRFPNLANMARTFLSCPASSAEAERIFSLAGRMHGHLAQRTNEATLQASLLGAYNTP